MKKLLLFSVLSIFSLTSVFAQEETEVMEEGGPQITFENETIDYGTIEQNADGHREFVFTNTGDQPLVINRCQGTCGCTVPECQKEPVLPGESGTIQVKYATNRLGSFNKGVKVYSNATPEGTPITVYIKGKVLDAEQYKDHTEKQAAPDEGENKEE